VEPGLVKSFLSRCLPCLYDERDFKSFGESRRYILIKGTNIFVYTDESAASPIYAIPTESITPVKEDPRKPHPNSYTISPGVDKNFSVDSMSTVLLMDRTDKLVYQITFDISKDGEISNRFVAAILKSVKGRKTESVIYSDGIAEHKKGDQPQVPTSGPVVFGG